MRSLVRPLSGVVATLALVLGGVALAAPADASVSQGFISGTGTITDDWGDEGILSRTTFPNSNATGLWQEVLQADGFLTESQVDCRFGPTTEAATKSWQRAHGLGADGKVGSATFGNADNRLHQASNPSQVFYRGTRTDIFFFRTNGRYALNPDVVAFYRTLTPGC
jgi:peptidoglycan hydrolase-like protein with peptidoglycan-binding domain